MTGTDEKGILARLAEDPMDWLARLALADLLEEEGKAEAARLARDVAGCCRAGEIEYRHLSEHGRIKLDAVVRSWNTHPEKADLQGVWVTVEEVDANSKAAPGYQRHSVWTGRAVHAAIHSTEPRHASAVSMRWYSYEERGWLVSLHVHPQDVQYFIR